MSARRCNTLQHTATRCNTLQHTATWCTHVHMSHLLPSLVHVVTPPPRFRLLLKTQKQKISKVTPLPMIK